MERTAENYDKRYGDDFEGVSFDSDGGVIGTTTESSRAANAAAEAIESGIQDVLRHGLSETVPDDAQGHRY